jgi:hypothetical protein
MKLSHFWHILVFCLVLTSSTFANPVVQQCNNEVDLAVKGVQNQYKKSLKELIDSFQRAGDLDGYLATQREYDRFNKENSLQNKHLVKNPDPLRWVQENTIDRLNRNIYQTASKYIRQLQPELVSLTRQNKIKEAIAVKQTIEAIRAQYEESFIKFDPSSSAEGATGTDAKTLASFCDQNEDFAIATLKGKELTVFGTIGDVSLDFSDSNIFHVLLETDSEKKINFQFRSNQADWSQVTSGNNKTYEIRPRNNPLAPSLILAAGNTVELTGVFSGIHLNVNFTQSRFSETSPINEPYLVPVQVEDPPDGKKKKK